MHISESKVYQEDIVYVANLPINWEVFRNSKILISGATGLIGSFLVDVLMYQNTYRQLSCKILAIGRNKDKAKVRFSNHWNNLNFCFLPCDVTRQLPEINEKVDYVIHAASNTHPIAYATDPIGTITTNIIGTHNLLVFASEHKTKRFAFLSSVEIYGENRGNTGKFREIDCGYIDCNTLRAGYPESKRAGEALCQAYIRQKGLDIVIPRLSRVYGPTLLQDDSKALSQFLKKGVAGENIVLKSKGMQYFSYSYIADVVSGILYCLLYGDCGAAYNVADTGSDIQLKDLAKEIADYVGTKVVFEVPNQIESAGYSKATIATMDSAKLKSLGWHAEYDIVNGIRRTILILRECLKINISGMEI